MGCPVMVKQKFLYIERFNIEYKARLKALKDYKSSEDIN